MSQPHYIGRFAPSPTGLLHMGSLMTAIASYCDAMSKNGQWLVRIEDLDPPREVAGASHKILNSLNAFGFEFDQNVVFQSHNQRQSAYNEFLMKLIDLDTVYYCCCSRAELKSTSIANHQCRNNSKIPNKPYSIKIKVPDLVISFDDEIQGIQSSNLLQDYGDFVIQRKDQLFAYQIAVVVDDAYQGITNTVRGIDLIDSTPWQIYLNSLLGFNQMSYAHLPILVNSQGQKLSKQTFAKEIDPSNTVNTLMQAYSFLNQAPFLNKPKSISDFWKHAINNWNINNVSKIDSITV